MTIKELLKTGSEELKTSKTASLDTEILLCHVLGCEKEHLISHAEDNVSEDLMSLFDAYILLAEKGRPIAYIVCEKVFFGLDFFVDQRVLVPRPETEMLVEKAIESLSKSYKDGEKASVLDVGTGSGNIAVSVAKACREDPYLGETLTFVDAVDISEDAVQVAKINVEQYNLEDLIQVFQSDLLENIDDESEYGVIAANLPYIGEKKNDFVEENVRKNEPGSALFAGENGLMLYEKLFKQIKDKKIKYNVIIGEFGDGQRDDLEELLEKYFPEKWEIYKDLAEIDRMFVINK